MKSRSSTRFSAYCLLASAALCATSSARAQSTTIDLRGSWTGVLQIGAQSLRLAIDINGDAQQLRGTLRSLDQGGDAIDASPVQRADSIFLTVANLGLRIRGTANARGDTISAEFRQGPVAAPLVLVRGAPTTRERPQTPRSPFPYRTRDIAVPTRDGALLSGTLVVPSDVKAFPTVLVLSGSGPQDRDGTVFDHRPFAVLADYLARRGVASFRFDDRGVGASTVGRGTGTAEELVYDARTVFAALRTQPELDTTRLGVLGHSEGATIAAALASAESSVRFVISLSGSGVRGDSLLMLQNRALLKAMNVPDRELEHQLDIRRRLFNVVVQDDSANFVRRLNTVRDELLAAQSEAQRPATARELGLLVSQLQSPWLRSFIRTNPAVLLRQVRVPVLAIAGSLDLQVPPIENLGAIRAALVEARNQQYTETLVDGLNHLLQPARSGLPAEYADIPVSISESVLQRIVEWLRLH